LRGKDRRRKISVLSAGTDGIDGNSQGQGQWLTVKACAGDAIGLEPAEALQRSDAFTFFFAFGGCIVIGPTGNNLRDLRILIAEP